MATTAVDDSCATQVQIIDGEGVFNITGLDNFIKTSDMANAGLNYIIAAAIGSQSSGKSTLMNQLFHTRFKEMDAFKGRSQTTNGIWIDTCTGIKQCTIVLDIEGTDGRERGENDTAFEKHSAVFCFGSIRHCSISAQKIWKSIRENKDLNLPTLKVMVATMRCEAIAKETLDLLRSNKGWLKLMEDAQSGLVQGFGEKLNSIIATYHSRYDDETVFYDEAVRNAKWKQMESDALNEAYLAYTTMIEHLRSEALADFKTKLDKFLNNGEEFASSVHMWTQSIMLEFEKGSADAALGQTNWDASKVQQYELLRRDIDSHAESLEIKTRKKAGKSAKTLALVKEVSIGTAVGATVGVAGVATTAAVIGLTGPAVGVAGAAGVVALAAPVLSVMYSVYEIINKYTNKAKPVKDRA